MREDKILIQKSGDLEKDQPLLGKPKEEASYRHWETRSLFF